MRVPTTTATCSLCGEGGIATRNDEADQWYGAKLTHTDPNICVRNIKRKLLQRLKQVAQEVEEV